MIVALLLGCRPAAPVEIPLPELEHVDATALPDVGVRLERDWVSPAGAAHPLVGWIWDARGGRYARYEDLLADLRRARYVSLGEKHDNVDHHALQARLIADLAPSSVVFEHLDREDGVEGATDAASLAERSRWSESGWPDFAMYQPIFEAVYAAGATVIAGHPTRADVKLVMSEGFLALPLELRQGLVPDPAVPPALPEAENASLAAEIEGSHCGMATPELIEKMTRAQLLKDTSLARALRTAVPGAGPVVLVAGNGHTRSDRGAPFWLDGERRTVAFLEVVDGELEPAAYVEGADWVVFTPRVDDDDPCEAFRR